MIIFYLQQRKACGLFSAAFSRGGVTSKCIKEHKCSSPVLPHSVKMCLERPAGRDKHEQ
jgi:hypothetical protein